MRKLLKSTRDYPKLKISLRSGAPLSLIRFHQGKKIHTHARQLEDLHRLLKEFSPATLTTTVHAICSVVGGQRTASRLTAPFRVFIMAYFRVAATEWGHLLAGHGIESTDKSAGTQAAE